MATTAATDDRQRLRDTELRGRAGASLLEPLGSARLHGCIRIENHWVCWLAAHLPAGTPVLIKR